MALIGKIRENSWLLIAVMGLALAGFILMDMVNWSNRGGMGDQFKMGKVAGKTIDWNDFQRSEQILYSNAQGDPYARRQSLWNYFVEEAIISKEAEALGLGVSKDEIKDLEFGNNLSPIIQQRFGDPNTRQVDMQRLMQIKQAIEKNQLPPQLQEYWAEQQKEIVKDRLQSKLAALVSKSLYLPTWQANQMNKEQNTRVNFNYVKIPYEAISDDQVKVADSDLTAYLNENKGMYKRDEETRKVAYVTFNVLPTAADSVKIVNEINALVGPFGSTTDDSSFVENNLGIIDETYYKKEELSPAIADIAFSQPVGSVYGPYKDGNAIKAVKILGRKAVADSVRARHILIGVKDASGLAAAEKTIDSLKTLIETGKERFDTLASRFGQDGTRTKGGDLGFAAPGAMVKPFNDLIFFKAEPRKLYTVTTQFGVHLVEVTDRKASGKQGARVAYVQQSLLPSKETEDSVYQVALEFVGKHRTVADLEKAVKENPTLKLEYTNALAANDFQVGALGGGQTGRDLVRWAYNNDVKEGDVSREVFPFDDPMENYTNKYIVAGLKSIQPAGVPSLAGVKEEITKMVANIKKAEYVKGRIAGQDLATVASSFTGKVDTANAVAFNAMFVPGIGSEPKLIAATMGAAPNTIGAPVAGNSGIFVYQVNSKEQPTDTPADVAALRRQYMGMQQGQVRGRLMQALRKTHKVEDNRTKFF